MITTTGKTFLKRYMAGQAGQMVGALSIGVGATAAALGDKRLDFEFARIPVDIIAYDFVADRLIFKGSLPEEVAGKIYEVGVWTSEVDPLAGNQASRLITTFDSNTETWTGGTFDTTTVRIGADSLKQTPAASATSSAVMSNLTLDFVDNSAADLFVLAYNVDNAFTSAIRVRLRKDATNYFEFVVNTPTTGYKISTFTKGSAAVTGTPSWDEINEIEIRTTATAGGSASVEFDGLRIEDADTTNPEYGLIARFIPASPITKDEGSVQDFEYSLAVSV